MIERTVKSERIADSYIDDHNPGRLAKENHFACDRGGERWHR